MSRNTFVYEACERNDQAVPDIEVRFPEHYGQVGEDLIVESLLAARAARLGEPLEGQRYLEIGANHPFATSSTYLLNRRHGMRGVLVEANQGLLDDLRRLRSDDEVVHAAIVDYDAEFVDFFVSSQSELSSTERRFVEEWPAEKLEVTEVQQAPALRPNVLLERYFADQDPIYVSIDVEGGDLVVMEDIDWARWRPYIFQAEPSEHFYPGMREKMIAFMHSVNYILAAETHVNLIFVNRDEIQARNPEKHAPWYRHVSSTQKKNAASIYSETCSVGIVTRTKNRPVLLRRAFESVKRQTYPHWELVVVNDGGDPDPVNRLISAVFGDDERVRVIHHEQSQGMEAASNAGISVLGTDLAIIHDDDDSWAPEMLSVGTQILRTRNQQFPSIRGIAVGLNNVYETVSGNHIQVDNLTPWQAGPDQSLKNEGVLDLSKMLVRNLFPPIAFIFDLSICKDLGMFDDVLPVLGDWDFHIRFCSQYDVWIHPEVLAFYHHRPKASGVMGNTVHAETGKHLIYNTFVRNRWLREGMAGAGVGSPMASLMRDLSLKLEHIEDGLKGS
ncbi:glycosyltransferase [Amorphus sp. 3PC139-8]|uniref:glycosyltransferase n=1 Tax=Amorphus sp. 3PC139-8 TaxID=2735676 RepID=UPI00345D6D2C